MNKPKIKDTVLCVHPIIGEVTVGNIIDMLKYWLEYTEKYETISLELLHKSIDENTFYSLIGLLSAKTLREILSVLESNIE